MSSIEDEATNIRDRALVIARLCDAASQGSWNEERSLRRRESGFWNGLESLIDEVVSFLERLPRVVSGEVLNLEMPPEGDPLYEEEPKPTRPRTVHAVKRRRAGRSAKGRPNRAARRVRRQA